MNKFVFVVLALALAACTTEATPGEAKQILSGRNAVVFGSESFVEKASVDLERYGASFETASDLDGAIELSGDHFVELHCKGYDDLVVQAEEPILLAAARFNKAPCREGLIFVGYASRTTDHPYILLVP